LYFFLAWWGAGIFAVLWAFLRGRGEKCVLFAGGFVVIDVVRLERSVVGFLGLKMRTFF
jgi:hypothetical protein